MLNVIENLFINANGVSDLGTKILDLLFSYSPLIHL